MLQIPLFFLLLIALTGCNEQTQNKGISSTHTTKDDSTRKKLTASFAVDDSVMDIKNHFSIQLLNAKDTINPSINGTEIIFPELTRDTGYTVVFHYNNYNFSFHGLTKAMLVTGQDMEWKFGIDNRPFNHSLGLLREEEFKSDKTTNQLQFLQFNPLEFGDGIQFVNKIK